jgi:hypothetical protein
MDTDIRNYNYDEILDVLQINDESLTKELLKEKISESIEKLSDSSSLSSRQKNEYIHFFNSCFHEVCRYNNFIYEITEPVQYIGALPRREPNVVTINTNRTKYTQGEVNPIQRETIKNTMILGHTEGMTGSPTDFSVTLKEQLSNVVSMKVAGIEFANFFYNISTYLNNNKFIIITYLRNTLTGEREDKYSKEIILNDGFYNIASFINSVEAQLLADPKTNMINFVYDVLKGKLYFDFREAGSTDPIPTPPPEKYEWEFDLNFYSAAANKQQTIGNYMGYKKTYYSFEEDYNLNVTPTSEVGFITEMCADFSGSKFFLLEITDYNNNAPSVLLLNNYAKSSDLIAKIPNKLPMSNMIFEDSSDRIFKTRKYFGPVKIQKLRIRLLDQFGKVVDNNCCDFSVTLEFESLDVPYKQLIN